MGGWVCLVVATELPQTAGPLLCSSPSVQHLSLEIGTEGVGGRGGGCAGGRAPFPASAQGAQPSCKGIKTFCAWKTRSVCESEGGLVLGGATFSCHLPSSLNASAIMINLSGTYEYADETLVSRLCFQDSGCMMGFLLLPPS